MKIKNITLRIDGEILEKFRIVSKYEMRSVNNQINILIMRNIKEFEAEHGKIKNPSEK
ncbi:MAG: Arc family DNA-binding protein [Ruminococcaceae bacterium]|nr:Arc family DNA-binding protein [Oscillospiraceae bacterium]